MTPILYYTIGIYVTVLNKKKVTCCGVVVGLSHKFRGQASAGILVLGLVTTHSNRLVPSLTVANGKNQP